MLASNTTNAASVGAAPVDSSGSNERPAVITVPDVQPVASTSHPNPQPRRRHRQHARPPPGGAQVVDLTVANPVLGQPVRPAPPPSSGDVEIVAVHTRPPASVAQPAVTITEVRPARRPRPEDGEHYTSPSRRQRTDMLEGGMVQQGFRMHPLAPPRAIPPPVQPPALPQLPPSPKEEAPRCPVCLEGFRNPSCGPCGHLFCNECLVQVAKANKKCPVCKKGLVLKQIKRVYFA